MNQPTPTRPPFMPLVDMDQYCERIGYSGAREPTLATLRALLMLHTQAIPFENLTPLSGQPVELTTAALTRKLLQSHRGGYCFEHNLLLWNVLQQLGFIVHGLAARVRWQVPDTEHTPLMHMLLVITLADTAYVADVGFGGASPSIPLQLQPHLEQHPEQHSAQDRYQLTLQHDLRELQMRVRDAWWPLYQFNLTYYYPNDFQILNWYTSTSPDSKFTRTLSAARCDGAGRHTLRDNVYTWRHADGTEQRTVLTHCDDIKQTLTRHLQIAVPSSALLDQQLARLAALPAT